MVQSVTITPATATPLSTNSKKLAGHAPSVVVFQKVLACHGDFKSVTKTKLIHRRTVGLGLVAAVVSLSTGKRNANAARRPPPPPPEEKRDPNVSGVQAKVLASKKRKEAMKESVAKLREKGKPVSQPASPKASGEASPESP